MNILKENIQKNDYLNYSENLFLIGLQSSVWHCFIILPLLVKKSSMITRNYIFIVGVDFIVRIMNLCFAEYFFKCGGVFKEGVLC